MDNPVIGPAALPDHALLQPYRDSGAYADCFAADIDVAVTQTDYVEAFYCSGLFRLERWVLAVVLGRPSSDRQARQLAKAEIATFAAWAVEARTPNQLLLCDVQGRTRSWLMSEPSGQGTRLYFGSAVVPLHDASGRPHLGWVFRMLLGVHKGYSRRLLQAAARRLRRRGGR